MTFSFIHSASIYRVPRLCQALFLARDSEQNGPKSLTYRASILHDVVAVSFLKWVREENVAAGLLARGGLQSKSADTVRADRQGRRSPSPWRRQQADPATVTGSGQAAPGCPQ